VEVEMREEEKEGMVEGREFVRGWRVLRKVERSRSGNDDLIWDRSCLSRVSQTL
jgi:hypothetical protein